MASRTTKWIFGLMKSHLRQIRHILEALNPGRLPPELWSRVCDFACEDPRIINIILSKTPPRVFSDDGKFCRMIVYYKQNTGVNAIAYVGSDKNHINDKDYHDRRFMHEEGVLNRLLMIGDEDKRIPLDDLDIKMRRLLYSKIQ